MCELPKHWKQKGGKEKQRDLKVGGHCQRDWIWNHPREDEAHSGVCLRGIPATIKQGGKTPLKVGTPSHGLGNHPVGQGPGLNKWRERREAAGRWLCPFSVFFPLFHEQHCSVIPPRHDGLNPLKPWAKHILPRGYLSHGDRKYSV